MTFLRTRKNAQATSAAARVEAAFTKQLDELGWGTGTEVAYARLGDTQFGALWRATCTTDGNESCVYVLDSSEGAEAFVAMSSVTGELALRDDVTAALDQDTTAALGFNADAWDAALLKALTRRSSYHVIKADQQQRYTLGVAYPAGEVDSHGDYTTQDVLEKAAWEFMLSGQAVTAGAGTDHADGTDLSGRVVESYIYRGPNWQGDTGEQIANSGDWMLGVVWGQQAWDRILRGELTGYSIQGLAKIVDEAQA